MDIVMRGVTTPVSQSIIVFLRAQKHHSEGPMVRFCVPRVFCQSVSKYTPRKSVCVCRKVDGVGLSTLRKLEANRRRRSRPNSNRTEERKQKSKTHQTVRCGACQK